MTSFMLSPNTKSALVKEARRLLDLRVADKERDVPLTPEQAVEATMPIEARQCFDKLTKIGSNSCRDTSYIYAIVPTDAGITRPALIEITFAKNIFYVWEDQTSCYTAQREFNARYGKGTWPHPGPDKLPFDMSKLDVPTQIKFSKWFNAAVYERRLCDAAYKIINEFIQEYCNSTGELYRRWPGLRILFAHLDGAWPARMRAVTSERNGPSRWGWPGYGPAWDWYVESLNKLQGVEVLLVEASTMIDSEEKRKRQYYPKPKVPVSVSISYVQKDM